LNLNDQLVSNLFDKWGGIPRYVLNNATNPIALDLLEFAIATADASKVLYSIGEISGPDDVSHCLIHMSVGMWYNILKIDVQGENFQTTFCMFASNYVAERITQKFYSQQRDTVRQFLRATEDEFRYGFLRGYLYEPMVHTILRNGGEFKIRELVAGNFKTKPLERILKLNPTTLKEFSALSEVVEPDKYYVPRSASFAAGDAIIVPNRIFQITMGESHPIPIARLADIATQLSKIHPLQEASIKQLFFVVPPDRFQFFVKQSLLNDKGHVAEQVSSTILHSVKQYALRLSLCKFSLCVKLTI
jgi:hypothetical protein